MSQSERVFGKFKTSKGSDGDGIANNFLKIGLPVIAESLCDMFNLSIATGVFPDSWKIARVGPIFKSRQSNDCSNTPFQQNGACWVIRIDLSHALYCFYCAGIFSRPWKLFLERFMTILLN